MTIEIPGIPVAQPRQRHRYVGQPGAGFIHNYTPGKHPVNDFKATVRLAVAPHFPKPLEGALKVSVTFIMPRPKSKMWKKRAMLREPHTAKPDADNLAKSLKDSLKSLAYKDDAQVADLHIRKLIAAGDEGPKTLLTIEAFDE